MIITKQQINFFFKLAFLASFVGKNEAFKITFVRWTVQIGNFNNVIEIKSYSLLLSFCVTFVSAFKFIFIN